MQAAFITCVGPRPALCRRLGGEKFGLRFSTAAIAKRRAAAINSRSATATPAPIIGNAAVAMKTCARLIEDFLSCNEKPCANQSILTPSTCTVCTYQDFLLT